MDVVPEVLGVGNGRARWWCVLLFGDSFASAQRAGRLTGREGCPPREPRRQSLRIRESEDIERSPVSCPNASSMPEMNHGIRWFSFVHK